MANANQRRLLGTALLLAGDLLALLAFVYIGQRDHDLVDSARPVLGVLQTAAPFILPWILAGWWLGAFRQGALSSPRRFLNTSLNTWLVAAPLGLLVRAYVLGRAVIPTSFVLATLGFGGLFVLGWRLVFLWIATRTRRAGPDVGMRASNFPHKGAVQ
jgi:hypothetical protein